MKADVKGTVICKAKGVFKDQETGKEITYYNAHFYAPGDDKVQKVSVAEDVFEKLAVPELPVNEYKMELGSKLKLVEIIQQKPALSKPA